MIAQIQKSGQVATLKIKITQTIGQVMIIHASVSPSMSMNQSSTSLKNPADTAPMAK
jgi:hypothetical protein